jgi:hypothetical protein
MDNFDLKKFLVENRNTQEQTTEVYVVIPFYSNDDIIENDIKVFTSFKTAEQYKYTLEGSPMIVQTTIQ